MENLTYEQKVSLFGKEAADAIQAQQEAQSAGSSNPIPFPMLKKVSTFGSELGEFGDFVFGTKYKKEGNEKVIEDVGTNIGKSFDFIICNICYRYTKWDDIKSRTQVSNIFTNMSDRGNTVDYNGNPLPSSKEAKKAANWKFNRIVTGMIKASDSDTFEPVIWELNGMLLYTFGELVNKANVRDNGLLNTTFNLVTKFDSKGTTQYPVIDINKSSTSALPDRFFESYGTIVGDITLKMKGYVESTQYKKEEKATEVSGTSADLDEGWED